MTSNRKDLVAGDILNIISRLSGLSIGEIGRELAEHKVLLKGILSESQRTNGRVSNIESRIDIVEKDSVKIWNNLKQSEVFNNSRAESLNVWKNKLGNILLSVILMIFLWVLIITGIVNPPV